MRSIIYPLVVLLGPFTGYAGAFFGVDALRFPLGPGAGLAIVGMACMLLAHYVARWTTAAWILGILFSAWCAVWFGSGLVVLLSVAEL
jgi:hypothetical protein